MKEFDPLLLSRVRLGVISVLMTREYASFPDLRVLLELTQGNLGAHVQKLEEAGYVKARRRFVGKKPETSYRLTDKGRRAFLSHVEQLKKIADG